MSYNLGLAAIQVHDRFEQYQNQKIQENREKVNQLTEQLETLKNLLAKINSDRKGGKDLDYKDDADARALIEAIIAINPNLTEAGKYAWKGDEIDLLVDNLNNETKSLTNKINPLMMEVTSLIEGRNRVTTIASDCEREHKEGMRSFVRGQRV